MTVRMNDESASKQDDASTTMIGPSAGVRTAKQKSGQSIRRIASSTRAGVAELSDQTFRSPKQKLANVSRV